MENNNEALFKSLNNKAKFSTVVMILLGFVLKYAAQTPVVLFGIHAVLTLVNSVFVGYVLLLAFKQKRNIAEILGILLYLAVSLCFAYQSYGFYINGGVH